MELKIAVVSKTFILVSKVKDARQGNTVQEARGFMRNMVLVWRNAIARVVLWYITLSFMASVVYSNNTKLFDNCTLIRPT